MPNSADETIVRLAVAKAQSKGQEEIQLHFRVFDSVPGMSKLILPEQRAAFQAMYPKMVHPRRITVPTAAVAAALGAE